MIAGAFSSVLLRSSPAGFARLMSARCYGRGGEGGARGMDIVLRDARCEVRGASGFGKVCSKARRTQHFDWRRDRTLVRYASLWWHARARASVDMDNGMYALTPCCWCGDMPVYCVRIVGAWLHLWFSSTGALRFRVCRVCMHSRRPCLLQMQLDYSPHQSLSGWSRSVEYF